ncbi:MAG TPA: hypothetical protein VK026_08160 [Paenalcaligenes sp.]|nr:hypothetical protein [Paenalcaligenes sp.]
MRPTRPRSREQLILSLAITLTQHPRASMGELATLVGISRATLARHFASREGMEQAITDTAVAHASQALERAQPYTGTAYEALRRLISELLPIAELYAYVGQQQLADEKIDNQSMPLRNTLITLFQTWQSSGQVRIDMSAAWLVESMAALLKSTAAMIRSGRLARLDAVDHIFGVLWAGMSKN